MIIRSFARCEHRLALTNKNDIVTQKDDRYTHERASVRVSVHAQQRPGCVHRPKEAGSTNVHRRRLHHRVVGAEPAANDSVRASKL